MKRKPTTRSKPPKPKKSDETRARVLDVALARFRKRGFEATTMREIADDAGLSVGAAYYYFPSKEAILLAYYARNQDEHEALVAPALARARDLRTRLGLLMHQKLASVLHERKLLGAMVRRLADPSDPVSAFAAETGAVRDRSIAMFARALAEEPLPADLQRLVASALWFLHMGFLLYFVHDKSTNQQKTRRLVDDTLDFVVPLIALGAQPMTAPLVASLTATLGRAGLLRV